MINQIYSSPGWLARLGLIDDWGPEVSPADITTGGLIVAVRLSSGRTHLMRSDHLHDLPSGDPPAAAVIIEHFLIDETRLFQPTAG